jgi:hypothetical protein
MRTIGARDEKKSFSSSYFKNKKKKRTEGKRLEIGRVDSSGCEILAEPNDKRTRRRKKRVEDFQYGAAIYISLYNTFIL